MYPAVGRVPRRVKKMQLQETVEKLEGGECGDGTRLLDLGEHNGEQTVSCGGCHFQIGRRSSKRSAKNG